MIDLNTFDANQTYLLAFMKYLLKTPLSDEQLIMKEAIKIDVVWKMPMKIMTTIKNNLVI